LALEKLFDTDLGREKLHAKKVSKGVAEFD
jgi:hypothetical protein